MTIYGWDLSHYDAPDSRHAVPEGFSFLTHKAGGDQDDAEIAQWWTYMKPLRGPSVLLGAYWVQYPGNAAGRADAFLSRLDATCPGWRDGPFILQVDCEEWNGNPATKPSLADVKAFCARLTSKMPLLRPIVYAPPWAYHDELTGLCYPLWASRYVSGSGYASVLYPGDTSSLWAAYSGQKPAILQFTSSANIAGQTTCDANAYVGTIQQLTALVAPGWTTDMTFEADQVPINYPAKDPTNPTWTGPNALGDTHDKAAATLDIVKSLQATLALNQTALLKAIGAADDGAAVVAAVQAESTKIQQLLAAGVPANVDVATLAATLAPALDALLPDVTVTPDVIEQAFAHAFAGQTPAPTPPAPAAARTALAGIAEVELADVDARTRADREAAQNRIQGGPTT